MSVPSAQTGYPQRGGRVYEHYPGHNNHRGRDSQGRYQNSSNQINNNLGNYNSVAMNGMGLNNQMGMMGMGLGVPMDMVMQQNMVMMQYTPYYGSIPMGQAGYGPQMMSPMMANGYYASQPVPITTVPVPSTVPATLAGSMPSISNPQELYTSIPHPQMVTQPLLYTANSGAYGGIVPVPAAALAQPPQAFPVAAAQANAAHSSASGAQESQPYVSPDPPPMDGEKVSIDNAEVSDAVAAETLPSKEGEGERERGPESQLEKSEPNDAAKFPSEDVSDLTYSKEALLALFVSGSYSPPNSLQVCFPCAVGSEREPLLLSQDMASQLLLGSPKGGASNGGGRDFGRGGDGRDALNGAPSSSRPGGRDRGEFHGGRDNREREQHRDYRDRDRDRDRERDREGLRATTANSVEEGDALSSSAAPLQPPQSSAAQPQTYQSIFGDRGEKGKGDDADAVIRRATLILNKLSVTNFKKLSEEFIEVIGKDGCDTEELLEKVVELLITKAQMEENFCFMYADLCKKISETWVKPVASEAAAPPVEEAEEVAAREKEDKDREDEGEGGGGAKTMGARFREILLHRLQAEFKLDLVDKVREIRELPDISEEERTEKEILLKKRYMGHMRFIGEVYIKDLIIAKVVKEYCLDVLVKETEEEQLTCLSKLMQTVGDKIEKYYMKKSKAKKNKDKGYHEVFNDYFKIIAELATNHSSSRVRYMLRDLTDMRNNNWTPRHEVVKVLDLNETRNTGSAVAAAAGGTVAAGLPVSVSAPASASASIPNAASTSASTEEAVTSAAEPPKSADEWTQVAPKGKKSSGAPVKGPSTNSKQSGSYSGAGSGGVGSGAASASAPGKKPSSSTGNMPSSPSKKPQTGGGGVGGGATAGKTGRKGGAAVAAPRQVATPSGPAEAPKADSTTRSAPLAAQEEPVPATSIPQTSLEASTAKKAKAAMDEYYCSGILEEASAVLSEIVTPSGVADLVKVCPQAPIEAHLSSPHLSFLHTTHRR